MSLSPTALDAGAPNLLQQGRASFSPCGRYRYQLRRYVGPWERACVFVMLNPSTADAEADDPTIRRCKTFAADWRCGQLVVVNLFAWRATQPSELASVADPVGPENDRAIAAAIDLAMHRGPLGIGLVVAAWGADGSRHGRAASVIKAMRAKGALPQCLGVTASGQPRHPLYLAGASSLLPFTGDAA